MQRESLPALLCYRLLDRLLMPWLLRAGVQPNQVSVAGLALSGLAALGFVVFPPLGSLTLVPAGLCDMLDGHLARRLGDLRRQGSFVDSVLDRYGETLLAMGIWYRLQTTWTWPVLAGLTVLLFLSGSLLVSYTRARGEGLGVQCSEGLLQRPERLLAVGAAGLADPLLPGTVLCGTLAVLALGTHLTALQRFFLLRARLAGGEESHSTTTT